MRKALLIISILLSLILSSCSAPTKKSIELSQFSITIPEHADVNAFCYNDGKLYYAITYYPYFEMLNAEGIDYSFSNEFNSAIMQYSVETDEYKTLYTYDNDYCVTVESITYDSINDSVVWEDHIDGFNYRILSVYVPSGETRLLFTSEDIDSTSFSIILNSVDGVLYWYDMSFDAEKSCVFDMNAYENGHFYKRLTGLYLASPYEKIRLNKSGYAYVNDTESGNTLIYVDSSGKKQEIEVTEKDISNVYVSEDYVVWGNGYNCDYGINVFNLKTGEQSEIVLDYYFSYALLKDKLVLGTDKALVQYDLNSMERKVLLDNIAPGFIVCNEKEQAIIQLNSENEFIVMR